MHDLRQAREIIGPIGQRAQVSGRLLTSKRRGVLRRYAVLGPVVLFEVAILASAYLLSVAFFPR